MLGRWGGGRIGRRYVAVLGTGVRRQVASEADLLGQLRPGVDGLVLQEGEARAAFLPDVWQSLPDPRDFIAHLKQKAGLAPGHWSPEVRVWRYTTRSIG